MKIELSFKRFVTLATVWVALACLPALGQESKTMGQASFSFNGGLLTVSTGTVQRQWSWTGKGFLTTSYKNLLTGKQWAEESDYPSDWSLPVKISQGLEAELLGIQCVESNDEGFTSRHLLVIASMEYDCGLMVNFLIRAYPAADGIWTSLEVKALDSYSHREVPEDIGHLRSYGSRQPLKIARCDFVPVDFSTKTTRRYWGFYNDPGHRVNTKDMVREEVKKGWPLFQDEQIAWASGVSVESGGQGLIAVKESNKTVNKYGHQTGAFYCTPKGLEVTGWGLKPSEISTQEFRRIWATWTICFAGGQDEMELALKQFDRVRYPVKLETDMHILIDTWGSDWQNGEGSKIYGRENSAFDVIEKEIKSASDLGIDIVRIDDGWQAGKTLAKGGLWHPNPKVGYDPEWSKIRKLSQEHDVRIGLWAAVRYITPEELIANQQQLEVATWKFDFDKLEGWESFHGRLEGARDFLKASDFKTQLSWCPEYDDQRYGWYSPVREFGPMYFQNIQNNFPSHLVYVPYITLRHHWMMSKFYNLADLQCHWQNPSRTHSGLSDAKHHSQSYAAMSAFMGAPSCFMLTQLLKPEERDELRNVIRVYKEHRRDIFESYNFPIGDEPSNDSWTGFQLYHPGKKTGHLMVFRELHNAEKSYTFDLKFLENRRLKIRDLFHGDGAWEVETDGSGSITLTIPAPAGFRFLKYEILDEDV